MFGTWQLLQPDCRDGLVPALVDLPGNFTSELRLCLRLRIYDSEAAEATYAIGSNNESHSVTTRHPATCPISQYMLYVHPADCV